MTRMNYRHNPYGSVNISADPSDSHVSFRICIFNPDTHRNSSNTSLGEPEWSQECTSEDSVKINQASGVLETCAEPNELSTEKPRNKSTTPPKRTGDAAADHYKTRMCKNFMTKGSCPYGLNCCFAHGRDDLHTYSQNVRMGLTSEAAVKSYRHMLAAQAMHVTHANHYY